jgi:hypothetical protein
MNETTKEAALGGSMGLAPTPWRPEGKFVAMAKMADL